MNPANVSRDGSKLMCRKCGLFGVEFYEGETAMRLEIAEASKAVLKMRRHELKCKGTKQ